MRTALARGIAAAAVAAGIAASPAPARPDVIRDNRFDDLAIAPTLGRGYAVGANSLHSVCFESTATTAASFDFDFHFEELTYDQAARHARSERHRGARVDEFLRAHARTRTVTREGTTHHVHYLLATLTVDSYYASLDEARAKLSASALALLESGDVLGFFTSCGTYYIRSLARQSQYLTLFRYTAASERRDHAFEEHLQRELRAFAAGDAAATSRQETAARLAESASARGLEIVSRSIGLGAQSDATMVPFDLASYKEAVRQAFKASQHELAGRVIAAEVTPWLANPTVLAALDLAARQRGDATPYQRRMALAENAELYLALAARVQDAQHLLQKAYACSAELEQRVLVDGALPAHLARAEVIGRRSGARLPLATLVDAVSDANLARLAAVVRAFAVGGPDAPGAGECIRALEEAALVERSHDQIPACAAVAPPHLPGASVIDDYCLPQLAPAVTP